MSVAHHRPVAARTESGVASCVQGCQPDVSIFNSMIAACAHGGEFNKARLMFERMAEHSCAADAVTYANLIRAYKKGGQWCHALDTFEAMQRGGCRPHAAVFSSIIDVLWQTGISWAQAKALRLFASAVEYGPCLISGISQAPAKRRSAMRFPQFLRIKFWKQGSFPLLPVPRRWDQQAISGCRHCMPVVEYQVRLGDAVLVQGLLKQEICKAHAAFSSALSECCF